MLELQVRLEEVQENADDYELDAVDWEELEDWFYQYEII